MNETPDADDGETTIRIPDELGERIRSRITDTDFESLEEYVQFVLQEVVSGSETGPDEQADTGHEAEIEERLENLGYR